MPFQFVGEMLALIATGFVSVELFVDPTAHVAFANQHNPKAFFSFRFNFASPLLL